MPDSPINKRKLVLLESDAITVARVRRLAGAMYDVCAEIDAERAVERLADTTVAVFIAGAEGDGMSAVTILEGIRSTRPDVLRILLATPGHLAAVVRGLHSGAVERPAQKPIDDQELMAALVNPRPGAAAARLSVAVGAA